MNQEVKVAVIGCGVTGISTVNHIVSDDRYTGFIDLDLYDREDLAGKGPAYRSDSDHLLINIPTEEMHLSDDANDYIEWLKSKGYPPAKYTSRKQFGEYTKEKLESLLESNENIHLIFSIVDDVSYDSETKKFTLTAGGEDKVYDYVFLTMGMLRYSDPYDLEGMNGYVQDPYPVMEKMADLKGETGIIGTGLSAIDCIRYLILENKKERVFVFSRSGEMPSVRGAHAEITLHHFTKEKLRSLLIGDEIPLESLRQLFLKEMEANNVDYSLLKRRTGNTVKDLKYDMDHPEKVGRLHYLIMALNPVFSEIFQYLSRNDKKIFMDKYHPYINENHSPMPREAAEKLIEWVNGGRLFIVDDMESVKKEKKFSIRANENEYYKVDTLINATGPVKDIRKDMDGLVGALYDRQLIGQNEFGGIMVDRERSVISPNIGTLEKMFALGALTVGADYMSTSVWLLIKNTKKLSDRFYDRLK